MEGCFGNVLLCAILVTGPSLVPLCAEDCNGNGSEDAEDIAAGLSRDCNGNSVPDECDLAATHLGFKPAGKLRIAENTLESLFEVLPFDFNNDGRADLAVRLLGIGGSGDRVSILLGKGDGGFGEPRIVFEGSGPTPPAVADLNGDGNLDLAIGVGYYGSFLEVFLGNGDGTFRKLPRQKLTGNAGVTIAEDFDGDGDVDLIFLNEMVDGILLLKNDGLAAFQEVVVRPAMERIDQFALAGDFDGDCDVDLLTIPKAAGKAIQLFRNRGDATFDEEPGRDDFWFQRRPVAADFDGDGDLDLLTSVVLLLNRGDGSFDFPIPTGLPFNARGILAADLDGDRVVDVLFPADSLDPLAPRGISIARNRGDGTFPPAERIPGESSTRPAAVADLNSDGVPDIVSMSGWYGRDWTIHVFLGTGTAEPQSADVNGNRVPDECEPDCDRDGLPDSYATAAGKVRDCNENDVPDLCDLQPWAHFERGGCIATGGGPISLAVADLDANGSLDLAFVQALGGDVNPDPLVYETDTRLVVFLNDGAGSFAAAQELDFGAFVTDLDAADLDGDGFPEIVAAKSVRGSVLVLRNDGAGTFEPGEEYRTVEYGRTVKAVDVNGDGLRDIILESQVNETYAAALLFQKEGMEFSPPKTFSLRGGLAALADLQGDGAPDLLIEDPRGSLWAALNNGSGAFPTQAKLGDGKLLAAADFDGDGDIDLAVDDRLQEERLPILNRGDATFEPGPAWPALMDLSSAVALDVDGDGDADIAGLTLGGLAVYAGDGKGGFGPLLIAPEDALVGRLFPGDFDLDGRSDLAALGNGPCPLEILFNRTEPPWSEDLDHDRIPDDCGAAIAGQLPSDGNQDGQLDLSDVIWLIGRLYLGAGGPWPCAGGLEPGPRPEDLRLLDANGDGALDISDPIALLGYLFLAKSPPPALGTACVPFPGCADRCLP